MQNDLYLIIGPDSGIPIPRPCYQINETNFGTDAASMAGKVYAYVCSLIIKKKSEVSELFLLLATAFASAATFFNHLAQSKAGVQEDAAYADILLMHATQLYNSSHSIVPYSRYQSSVPTILGAYASTGTMYTFIVSAIII